MEVAEEEDVQPVRRPHPTLTPHGPADARTRASRGDRRAARRRETLSHLQQAEAVEIRRKSDAFQARVEDFRAFFQHAAPFAVAGAELTPQHVRSIPAVSRARGVAGQVRGQRGARGRAQVRAAYARLDAFHHGTVEGRASVTALLAESAALQNSQDLFELYVFDPLLLTRCKASAGPFYPYPTPAASLTSAGAPPAGGAGLPQGAVGHGGRGHGHVRRVARHALGPHPGGRAGGGDAQADARPQAAQQGRARLRGVPVRIPRPRARAQRSPARPRARRAHTRRLLEEALRAMLTSLPLVSELHHPAMRSRHWTQLMRARARPAGPFCGTMPPLAGPRRRVGARAGHRQDVRDGRVVQPGRPAARRPAPGRGRVQRDHRPRAEGAHHREGAEEDRGHLGRDVPVVHAVPGARPRPAPAGACKASAPAHRPHAAARRRSRDPRRGAGQRRAAAWSR